MKRRKMIKIRLPRYAGNPISWRKAIHAELRKASAGVNVTKDDPLVQLLARSVRLLRCPSTRSRPAKNRKTNEGDPMVRIKNDGQKIALTFITIPILGGN